jgi:hypothetical protein
MWHVMHVVPGRPPMSLAASAAVIAQVSPVWQPSHVVGCASASGSCVCQCLHSLNVVTTEYCEHCCFHGTSCAGSNGSIVWLDGMASAIVKDDTQAMQLLSMQPVQ